MGGTRATENSRMYVHGADDRDASINVDGLSIDAQDDDGIQGYYNEAMIQEMAYTTSAISAESAKAGVRMNMIAQEGGNVFSGSSYISGSPPSWQADNQTQELIDRGWSRTCRSSAGRARKSPLYSTGAASRLPALFLGRILPVCSLVSPCAGRARHCHPRVSVRRGTFTTGC